MYEELKEFCGKFENIKVEVEEAVVVLTMNRPKVLNALNYKTLDELNSFFDYLAKDKEVLGLIITGEGKGFVAGADIIEIKEFGSEEGRKYFNYAQSTLNKIESLEKPVIAAVNGYALGGGCEMALCCDIRIASEKAIFGQPEADLGVIPAFGGTQRLPRLIGTGMAKELIFTGRKVRADEALALGIVNKVVVPEELLNSAKQMMNVITKKGPLAISYSKMLINRGMNMDLHNALELEKDCSALTYATEDKKEGMRAFEEKRAAKFVGK